jgi:hypothetical protein
MWARDASLALKAEGRRRLEQGSFFGHISCLSLTASKAASPLLISRDC